MKKLLAGLFFLGVVFAGPIDDSFYVIPTSAKPTTNYKIANISLLGTQKTISSSSGLTINSTLVRFTGGVSVNGTVSANKYIGDGSSLTGLALSSNVVTKNYSSSISINGTISANSFVGNGSGLTSLTAGNISGTVATANYATNATTATNWSGSTTYTGANTIATVGTITSGTWAGTAIGIGYVANGIVTNNYSNGVSINGTISANKFVGDGSSLTGISVTGVVTNNYGESISINGTVSANKFIGDGSSLTGIAVSEAVTKDYNGSVSINGTVSANKFYVDSGGIVASSLGVTINSTKTTFTGGITVNGVVSANNYSGIGLSSLPSTVVTNNYSLGVSINGVVSANSFVGTHYGNGANLTGLPVYLTTANADIRYISQNHVGNVTINGVLAATANAAFMANTSNYSTNANLSITSNYASTSNYSLTSNYALNFASNVVTNNYSSISLSATISANKVYVGSGGAEVAGTISGSALQVNGAANLSQGNSRLKIFERSNLVMCITSNTFLNVAAGSGSLGLMTGADYQQVANFRPSSNTGSLDNAYVILHANTNEGTGQRIGRLSAGALGTEYGNSFSGVYKTWAGYVDTVGNNSRGSFVIAQNNIADTSVVTAGMEVVRVDNIGNVGIGTYPRSPSAKLDVNGTVSASALQVNGNANYSSTSQLLGGISLATTYGNIVGRLSGTGTTGTVFDYSDATAEDRQIRLGGNSCVSRFGNESTSGGRIISGSMGSATVIANHEAYPLQLGTNNTPRMTILSTGLVGIGTATPSTALEVAGTVSANQFGTGWVNYSSPNSTVTGMTLETKNIIRYNKIGKTVYVYAHLAGTGTGTTTTFTLPYPNNLGDTFSFSGGSVQDSGAYTNAPSYYSMNNGSSTVTCYKGLSGAGVVNYTASAARDLFVQFFYETN